MVLFAEALLGQGCVREVHRDHTLLAGSEAALIVIRGRSYILLRVGAERHARDALVAHEIAEWYYYGRADERLERDCDELALLLLEMLPAEPKLAASA